ncbi:hypothetical protein MAC_08086 [Metarhizium acridum CQMa 102]|uniref:Nucleoside-diphosphate-sugar epimerase n=1 Tax=Metarhizium acridum (strain CQMa 102) TaxID=655827 RepID=E9EDY8_METAQ|nr:uncharacterized protein MAC_08086 [Metarhizium acridum CQMa 102]EFY85880.1 hypothetical protein MAC_08086 [Metarhizium acridum CQMa 102]
MKVIVAGATGLVGRHLLEQCISSSQITHIYTLSRKQLPNQIGTRAEVTAIRHDDFTSYPAGLLDQISDAEACLWAIGGLVQKFSSVEACKLANVTSTLAAATVFADHVAPHLKQGRKFRAKLKGVCLRYRTLTRIILRYIVRDQAGYMILVRARLSA